MNKILVIDDKKDNLISLKSLLNNYYPDSEVLTANSGIQGIKLAKSDQPDTIFLDVNMPKVDGYETCRRLRAEKETQRIPIIFITAVKTSPKDKIKGLEIGGDAYLSKPIDEGELVATLNAMLRIKKNDDDLTKEKELLDIMVAEKTEELQLIFDSSPIPLFVVNEDRRVQKANIATQLFTQQTEAEMIGKREGDVFRCIHSLDVPEGCGFGPDCKNCGIRNTVLKTFASKKSAFNVETELLLLHDGKYSKYYFRLSTTYLMTREGPRVVVVLEDITRQKKYEKKIFESKEKYRGLFNESVAAIYLFDMQKNFVDSNEAGLELLGYSREELLKLNISDVDENPEVVKPAHDLLLSGKRIINYEHNLRRKDGSIITVLNNSKPIRDSKNNIVGLQSTLIDITKRSLLLKQYEQIQKQLIESEYLNRSITQMANDAIISINNKGKVLLWNIAAERIFGYSQSEMLKKDILSIIPSQYKEEHSRGLERLINSGKEKLIGKTVELIGLKKDGTEFPIELSLSKWEKDNDKYFIGIIRDITERKLAEELLKESEAKYREIATSIPGVVYQFKIKKDGSYSFPYLSDNSEKYIQHKASDIVADPNLIFNMVPREELQSFIDSIDNTAKTMKEWRHDFRLRLPDGQIRWFEGRSVPQELPSGEKLWNGVIIDVTERKLALRAIEESEEKFRNVVEQTNDGIYVLQNDKFVFINHRFTEITGYSLAEISGTDFNFRDIVTEEGLNVLKKRAEKRKRGETVQNRYVIKIIRKDKQKRDLEISVSKFIWQNKPATLGTINDVTERLIAQLELEKALKKAQIGERVKTLFLENMSHEVRTPLNGILGFMELIEEKTRSYLEEDEQSFFGLLREQGNRLINTVHGILDISQLEAGSYEAKTRIHSLKKIVDKVVDKYWQAAKEKGLILEWTPDTRKDFVPVDEYAISTAINNLIHNAIKYTDHGKVIIRERINRGNIVLIIQDTGIGISPDYIQRLFQPFTQESEGYTKKYQGTGLGLAIAKRFLDMNHIEVNIKSKKGIGTSFELIFRRINKQI